MRSRIDPGRRQRRLRWLLGLLFLGLAIPSTLLIRQGFVQLELTEFRRQQLIAESLLRSIDARLEAAIAAEEARPAADFDYAASSADADAVVQLSPLSSLAAADAFPGAVGYFQVDASGQLSTPLLPQSGRDTLPADERVAKTAVEAELGDVLEANRLVQFRAAAAPEELRREVRADNTQQTSERARAAFDVGASGVRGQAVFDELARGDGQAIASLAESARPAAAQEAPATEPARRAVSVSTFAGDVEPLRFSQLETGHFVLFRNVWRDGERFVQGLLIDRDGFLGEITDEALARSAGLAPGTRLTVSAAAGPIAARSMDNPNGRIDGSLLYAARLSPPLAEIELEFQAGVLERGPGFALLVWTTLALIAVLVGGFFAMYRFGVQQLRLAQQQQNFVSAVSHELKTPLTSIRMYGEMLKTGWVDEAKRQTYYEYIYAEGERLSRLIENVLQLARLDQGGASIAPEPVAIAGIFDVLRSKLATQAERAGFVIEYELESDLGETEVAADVDALVQVFINLVDNAIKFAAEASVKRIVIAARRVGRQAVVLSVRDFGPGIPAPAMKRLFELFYRPDNELTRTTAGTGIGLALVKQLVTAMSGRVDVLNRDPGAEFRITLEPRA